MENIFIPHLLRCVDHTLKIPVDQTVLDLETLTPVRGEMAIRHQGNYLDVSAQADAIINLTCHRCLKQYNQRLQLDANEVIWLDDRADDPYDGPIERKVDFDDLVESVPPDGHFDPENWLYEHLCLALPQRQLCSNDCPGVVPDLVVAEEVVEAAEKENLLDNRWGSLAALRDKLPE
jgi:uncharacterized protein